ncbi:MAG: hypothetical protein JXJ22_15705 [Bacteroidales bacterium]|nr:hypothetical protein [Bacteroidales bacterium]
MDTFFTRLFEGERISPPELIVSGLNQNFPEAFNIEWFRKKEAYEAVFYKNNIEHIAIFKNNGILEEYKMYLPEGYLPDIIKGIMLNKGEIMNSVLINKGNSITYEIIFRDSKLNRFLLFINEHGEIIEEKKL